MLEEFKKLNPYVKLIIGVVALIIIYTAIIRFSAWYKIKSSQFELNQEQSVYQNQGQLLSYPPTQYQTYADTLASSTHWYNDDEQSIYTVFKKMRNDLDILELEKKYRVSYGRTISEFLSAVFNRTEINEVNAILRSNQIVRNY